MDIQAGLLSLGKLNQIHTFLCAAKIASPKNFQKIAFPLNFRDFVGSLARSANPRSNFLAYSLVVHPDKNPSNLEKATEAQKVVNECRDDQQLPATLKSLSSIIYFYITDNEKQHYQTKLVDLGQLVNLFPKHTPDLSYNISRQIQVINNFINDIHQNKHTTNTANTGIEQIEQTLANLFKSLFTQILPQDMVDLFKKLPETIQLKIVQTINSSKPSNQIANFNNLLYANYLIHSKNLSLPEKLTYINANFNVNNDDFKLCKEFIKQLVDVNHLFINRDQQVSMRENGQFIVIPVANNIKSLINTFYKEKIFPIIEQAFTEGSTNSISTIIDLTPANYLPIGLGLILKNIEQTFGVKTLQSLGQIAKLDTEPFKAVLSKVLRKPQTVNYLKSSSFLEKLNALCGILEYNQENIKLSNLLQMDLGILDNQLEALIKLRINGKFSIHRINSKDAHNLDMVVFKQDNTCLDLTGISFNKQALRVCQKIANLQVIKNFIKNTEPQFLVDFMHTIVRTGEINEQSIKNNLAQTILNLFENKEIGTAKLLQISYGKNNKIIPDEIYSAFIKLQLESNNFSVHELKKERNYTGKVIEKVVLKDTQNPSKLVTVTVTCMPDSYALLEAIKRQQAS